MPWVEAPAASMTVTPATNPVSIPVVARMIDPRVFDPAHSRRAHITADTVIPLMTRMARAYTRDRGFDQDGRPCEEIAAVITTASARLGANPTQAAGTNTDGQTVRDVRTFFSGWNLAELMVLRRYRRTAL